jgi:hypothetical protein
LPDPTQPERLMLPGGRGVYLMRHLVDQVRVDCAENGCTLVLTMRVPRVRVHA